ncbi:unnamed protein product [marine sediment metagenome]|uniref:Uncharacterized protein n=1 Tax=marine sediment metagenome TaxID=412755 RepID=X1KDL1_9ZZZZ
MGTSIRSLLGSDGRAIFDDANIDYCEGAVVIAIACKSGKWLSMSATSKGAIAYFSFRDICYLPQSSEKHAYMSDFIRTFSVTDDEGAWNPIPPEGRRVRVESVKVTLAPAVE